MEIGNYFFGFYHFPMLLGQFIFLLWTAEMYDKRICLESVGSYCFPQFNCSFFSGPDRSLAFFNNPLSFVSFTIRFVSSQTFVAKQFLPLDTLKVFRCVAVKGKDGRKISVKSSAINICRVWASGFYRPYYKNLFANFSVLHFCPTRAT